MNDANITTPFLHQPFLTIPKDPNVSCTGPHHTEDCNNLRHCGDKHPTFIHIKAALNQLLKTLYASSKQNQRLHPFITFTTHHHNPVSYIHHITVVLQNIYLPLSTLWSLKLPSIRSSNVLCPTLLFITSNQS